MSPLLLIGLAAFALLGHGYLWVDIVNRFHAWSGPRSVVDGVTLLCLLFFMTLPLLMLFYWSEWAWTSPEPIPASSLWLRYYYYFCAFWGITKLFLSGIFRYTTDNPKTLVAWRQEDLGVASLIGQETFVGKFPQWLAKVPGNQVVQLTVDHKKLAIPQLHANHEGLRIAHISDLHMTGSLGPAWYQIVADQVNQLQADVIAITGDLVEKEACWPWLADSLGTLRAKYGVYFIMGNHDYYIDTDHTSKLLEDQGLICLSQRWIETAWNDIPVILAGNERPWSSQVTDLSGAPAKNSEGSPLRLILMHTPDEFAWACDHEADLALAGHTHGGQLRFPLLGPIVCPSRFGTRYACGVFRRGNTVMHVTRGISGKTPLRWNCPPEIALLELVRG